MAANIQAYLENLKQPWGQIYYDIPVSYTHLTLPTTPYV